MKTKAAVLFNCNQPLKIIDLEIPQLKPGQVLVDIIYSGVCHSQLNEIKGLKGKDIYLPHTLGHEGTGIVLEIGQNVSKVKPGDHVVLTWIKGKGVDVPGCIYQSIEGPINSGAISTFMDKTIISENRLVSIPKEMPLKEEVLLGCAIPTGAGIVINNIKVESSNSVVVFGTGGVGLSSIMAASALGVNKVIAVDIIDKKLELAKKIGANHTINATYQDPIEEIMQITQGLGVSYAIEASGRKETMEQAFQSVCKNGGKCIIAGNLPNGEKISINPMDLIGGKKILGTWGGETDPDKDIPKYIDWHRSGKLNLGILITNEYKLEDINEAFNDLEYGKVGRALINLKNENRN